MANVIKIIDTDGKETIVNSIEGVNINFYGDNSVVTFKKPVPVRKRCVFNIGSNCSIHFEGSTRYITDLIIEATAPNSLVKFGINFSCYSTRIHIANERDLSVIIGDYCIFAKGTIIRTSDAHSIISRSEGRVLNKGSSVTIGNHCWVTTDCYIMKGVTLPDWTIVAAGAIVTKSFPDKYCIVGGSPARVLKTDVLWDYRDPYLMEHPASIDENSNVIKEVVVPTGLKEKEIYKKDIKIELSNDIWNSKIIQLDKSLKPNSFYVFSIDNSKSTKGDYIFFQLAIKDLSTNKPLILKNIFLGCKFEMAIKTTEKIDNIQIKLYSGEAGNSNGKALEVKNFKIREIVAD